MRYTRYDLKRKKRKDENKKMLLSVTGVIVGAIVIGTLLYKVIIMPNINQDGNKNPISSNQGADTLTNTNPDTNHSGNDVTNSNDSKENIQNYVMVQCGYYSKKENADLVINKLQGEVTAFSVTDSDKFRVIAYIGSDEEAQKLTDKLKSIGVDSAKGRFEITKSDNCNVQIIEMINGYLKILDKLKEPDVKGVNTESFKQWTNELKEYSDGKNIEIFKNLKTIINNLPGEITNDYVGTGYAIIFNILNNFRA